MPTTTERVASGSTEPAPALGLNELPADILRRILACVDAPTDAFALVAACTATRALLPDLRKLLEARRAAAATRIQATVRRCLSLVRYLERAHARYSEVWPRLGRRKSMVANWCFEEWCFEGNRIPADEDHFGDLLRGYNPYSDADGVAEAEWEATASGEEKAERAELLEEVLPLWRDDLTPLRRFAVVSRVPTRFLDQYHDYY